MINRKSTRITTEDKSKETPEIYKEVVTQELRVFGIVVFRSSDSYECEPMQTGKANKIGFTK